MGENLGENIKKDAPGRKTSRRIEYVIVCQSAKLVF